MLPPLPLHVLSPLNRRFDGWEVRCMWTAAGDSLWALRARGCVSRGSPWLMSCCTIRAEWAGGIDCPWDRNQLSGADYQNNRSESSQGRAVPFAGGSTSRVTSQSERHIHMAHPGGWNKSATKTAPLNFRQLIRQACWAKGPVASSSFLFFFFNKKKKTQKNELNYSFPLDSKFLYWFYLWFRYWRETCFESLEVTSKNTELRVRRGLTLVFLLKKFGSVG